MRSEFRYLGFAAVCVVAMACAPRFAGAAPQVAHYLLGDAAAEQALQTSGTPPSAPPLVYGPFENNDVGADGKLAVDAAPPVVAPDARINLGAPATASAAPSAAPLPSVPLPSVPLPSVRVPSTGTGIPAAVLPAYQRAAQLTAASTPGCRMAWPLLASIGRIESSHASGGRVDASGTTLQPILGPELDGSAGHAAIHDTDNGVLDGDTVWDRAVGPMQFLPATWRSYQSDGNGDGVMNPHNIYDAALASARYLCAGGGDMTVEADLVDAIFRYNHSTAYVSTVIAWAQAYASGVPVTTVSPVVIPTVVPSASPAQAVLAAAPTSQPMSQPTSKAAAEGAPAPATSNPPSAVTTPPVVAPVETTTPAPTSRSTPSPTVVPTSSATPTPTPGPTPTPTPSRSTSASATPSTAARATDSGTPTPKPAPTTTPTTTPAPTKAATKTKAPPTSA